MKAILVLFDSMARRFLPPYGNDWVQAPAFTRLAQRAVTFDKCFVGSMPCMPARRELHTGRYNFLHRAWGPLEPFDDSMPEILGQNGIYTHLVTDHYHYWEDGGATYHGRYTTYEFVRGQEGDHWKGHVADPEVPPHIGESLRQDWINRQYMRREQDQSQTKVFDLGLHFIETNKDQDNWFLQIECFDPHPPFFAPQRFRDLYPGPNDGVLFDWPHYAPRCDEETDERVQQCRREYAALVSMCSYSLGRVLDAMDQHDLWKDTLLIVTTDHGFLLGEHGWWAFVKPPFYDDVAVKPLFIWDPRSRRQNERNPHVVQTHDLPATLLEYFNVQRPADMQGIPLKDTLAQNTPVREAGLFGVFGGHVNCTDGRYVYMRGPATPENRPLRNYTLMPTHMRGFFRPEEIKSARLEKPFPFTKGQPLLSMAAQPFMADPAKFGTLLFDLQTDPEQQHPIHEPAIEARMTALLVRLMKENNAPPEQFERLGLTPPKD
ncbi:MAG TPA: sulfatase [Candidatus Brocadiia bacterium]|nr:sulfatase [Candidatus Brocadiia bacterium]